ncbi:MAG TPA: ADP-ribosylglycohydrolase family protein [Leifsonia sp.]|nr:ADP-ribosylglycohydrolase family protein [Leifsonia sp.]
MESPATSAANDVDSALQRHAGSPQKPRTASARHLPSIGIDRYAERVLGCWRGKAVGGTLGQSFEGLDGPIVADFYFPVPDGMVPNDDLDVQVVYAAVIAALEHPRIDRLVIAQAWRDHLRFPWNEYGVGKRNLAEGILPPHTGEFDNWFSAGEGAVIRTELWACLAPGDPRRAAAYAYEDACFDHSGDGIWAAVFMAALQSLAFVETDVDVLLDRASELLPVTSKIRQVVHDTRVWVAENESWQDVLGLITAKYGSSDFTDTRPNTGYVVLGLLASGGDFERAILITNGCGGDTDSTTASLGALLAIVDPDCIPARWLEPIGDDLILNKEVVGVSAPATILEFTDQVVALRDTLTDVWPEVEDEPFDPSQYAIPVTVGWASPYGLPWGIRDASGLAPEGAPEPEMPANATPRTVPGTWIRWKASDFEDLILVIEYTMHLDHEVDGRLMFNSSEHIRVWLDGEYLFGSQPSLLFPTQHRPPAAQGKDVKLAAGEHSLRVTILKPPAEREYAEWVVSLAENPVLDWVPGAFRP